MLTPRQVDVKLEPFRRGLLRISVIVKPMDRFTALVINIRHTYLVSCTVEHCCSLTVVHSFSYEVEHS